MFSSLFSVCIGQILQVPISIDLGDLSSPDLLYPGESSCLSCILLFWTVSPYEISYIWRNLFLPLDCGITAGTDIPTVLVSRTLCRPEELISNVAHLLARIPW